MSITFYTESSPEHLNLNVANTNGYMILRDILDISSPESWGSVSAAAVQRQAAVALGRAHGLTRPASESRSERVILSADGVSVEPGCSVIDCGRTGEQVQRYIRRLEALAIYALLKGEEILWG